MLKQRIITAIFLIAFILLAVTVFNPPAFLLTLTAIVALAAYEWSGLLTLSVYNRYRYVVCSILLFLIAYLTNMVFIILAVASLFWLLSTFIVFRYPHLPAWFISATPARMCMGLLMIIPFGLAAYEIRWGQLLLLTPSHITELLVVVALFATENTSAYFAGRTFGHKKLVPELSPGKTWAGLVGGFCTTLTVALLLGFFLNADVQQLLLWGLVAVVVDIAAVVGDLFESMQKRVSGVKDSGTLLPGHGGILDRIDSATAVLPLFAFLMMLLGKAG